MARSGLSGKENSSNGKSLKRQKCNEYPHDAQHSCRLTYRRLNNLGSLTYSMRYNKRDLDLSNHLQIVVNTILRAKHRIDITEYQSQLKLC